MRYGVQGLPKEETKGPCKFRLIQGDPTKAEMLKDAGVENADSLIVGGIENKDHPEADAVMLAMLMVLQDACARYKRNPRKPLHVIGQVPSRAQTGSPNTTLCSSWWYQSQSHLLQT